MLEWREDLEIGIPEIDSQHRELFIRLRDFFQACDEGRGTDELIKMLQFLDDYVDVHFKAEERYQKEIGFSDQKMHKELHRRFRQQLLDVKRQFLTGGTSKEVVASINRLLLTWLLEHISEFDRKMADDVQNETRH